MFDKTIAITLESRGQRLLKSILAMNEKLEAMKADLEAICKETGDIFVAGAKAEYKAATGYSKEEALVGLDLQPFMKPDFTLAFDFYAKKGQLKKEDFKFEHAKKLVITRSKHS